MIMSESTIALTQFRPAALPKLVPQQKWRAPKKNIPPTPLMRQQILQAVRHYVAEFNPVPPVPAAELKVHADKVVESLKCDPIYRDFIGVLLNNEMWREHLASVPFERRLLLLPKCLRVESKCPAPFDEFESGVPYQGAVRKDPHRGAIGRCSKYLVRDPAVVFVGSRPAIG